ncbi:hypothetical protein Lal_00026059 [Lupinus albus]|nr:hypothetical protein Lal_00026059 [Lupinus albus]
MGYQGKKKVRIESFTSSQALEQESKLLDLGNALFSHLSSILNLKCVWASFLSLERENPAHFKSSTLTLSLKRGILAQARISQCQQVPSRSSENLTVSTAPVCHFSPRRGNSRSGENLPEYEMFSMKHGEKILDLEKRFTHLTNHLIAVGKVLSNSDFNLKVLKSLTRIRQLKEHELELIQLDQHEELEKKKKNISLKEKIEKYESSEDEHEKEEMDDMSLFVKKFSKFLRRNNGARTGQMKRLTKNNEASTSNQNFT